MSPHGLKTVETIRRQLSNGQFEFSRHAFKRAVERNISAAEIIEDYPDDKYAPSCLLLGFTQASRPLHLQVSRADSGLARIITLYEPDETEWAEYSRRR